MTIKPRHPEKVNKPLNPIKKKPDWIRSKLVNSKEFFLTKTIVNNNNLVTVCQEANCPNITECWSKRHATFMIMGDTCTRACAFCDVKTGKPENLDYFLLGFKDNNSSLTQHKLNFSITYTSDERRNYSSANYCDKWNRCDNENQMDVTLIAIKASGCSSFDCDYNEIVELDLSDSFLKENMEQGLSMDFNSKASISSRVSIPSSYIKGYLKVAN